MRPFSLQPVFSTRVETCPVDRTPISLRAPNWAVIQMLEIQIKAATPAAPAATSAAPAATPAPIPEPPEPAAPSDELRTSLFQNLHDAFNLAYERLPRKNSQRSRNIVQSYYSLRTEIVNNPQAGIDDFLQLGNIIDEMTSMAGLVQTENSAPLVVTESPANNEPAAAAVQAPANNEPAAAAFQPLALQGLAAWEDPDDAFALLTCLDHMVTTASRKYFTFLASTSFSLDHEIHRLKSRFHSVRHVLVSCLQSRSSRTGQFILELQGIVRQIRNCVVKAEAEAAALIARNSRQVRARQVRARQRRRNAALEPSENI